MYLKKYSIYSDLKVNLLLKRNHRERREKLRVLKKGQFIKLKFEKLSIMI